MLKNKIALILIVITIFAGNLFLIINKNKEGEVLFDVQHKSLLGDQYKLIDWIYAESKGKPFTINTVTEPLFINTRWAFLFKYYAYNQYHYLPYWWGETQVDVPGSKIAFSNWADTDLHFLIVEPTSRSDDFIIKAVKMLENQRSEVVKRQRFGEFTVEERRIKKIQTFTGIDAANLSKTTDLKILKQIE